MLIPLSLITLHAKLIHEKSFVQLTVNKTLHSESNISDITNNCFYRNYLKSKYKKKQEETEQTPPTC